MPSTVSRQSVWSHRSPHRNVAVIDVTRSTRRDWEFRCLLTSDRHWDNPDSDRDMQLRHLEEAKAGGWPVVDLGDLFCAMQGKYDKRSDKSKVRQEHQHGDYLDRLVETAAEWFAPYARSLVVLGTGNHESSIRARHETSLTDRLIGLLIPHGGKVISTGFAGWVRFRFAVKTPSGKSQKSSLLLHYDHGWGGGGPVTRDVIQHQRRSVIHPDPQIIVSGHTHDQWTMVVPRSRLSAGDIPFCDECLHIKVPTYKDEYKDGAGGWHVETGKPPKPIGAWWLVFRLGPDGKRVVVDAERAR